MTGFICLNKQQDISSFWAVRQTLKLLGEKKGGHTGTLDPFATGVLPIAVGRATRFIELLPTGKKAYMAKIRLGITTDTLDITGSILSNADVNVSLSEVEKALDSFRGEISQIPPMYSAIRKDGVRLYDLARRGETVEREERKVTIYRLDFIDFKDDTVEIYVECSAGTYIRSLADDLGSLLDCGAVLSSLCRTKANGFSIENSVTLEDMRQMSENELKTLIIPLDEPLSEYEKINVSDAQAIRFKNGGELSRERINCSDKVGLYRVYSPADTFLGMGEIKENSDVLSVRRVVADE